MIFQNLLDVAGEELERGREATELEPNSSENLHLLVSYRVNANFLMSDFVKYCLH
jgi:hypothetical protein